MSFTKSHRSSDRLLGYAFVLPAFGVLALFTLYPVFDTIRLSFHRIILTMPQLGEDFVGFTNYRLLFKNPSALSSYVVTLTFVIFTTASELLLGLIIALLINKQFRGRGGVRAAILVPWALPTVVASQLWRFIFNDQYGFFNYLFFGADTHLYKAWLAEPLTAFGAILIADIWKTSSFAALIILSGLQVIPDELYFAARIDCASRWQQFRHITLPMIKPAILVALLFRTMDAFRVFDLVYVMTQGGPADSTSVIQFYGYKKIFSEGDLGYGSAVSTLIFLTILAISILYIRMIGIRMIEKEAR